MRRFDGKLLHRCSKDEAGAFKTLKANLGRPQFAGAPRRPDIQPKNGPRSDPARDGRMSQECAWSCLDRVHRLTAIARIGHAARQGASEARTRINKANVGHVRILTVIRRAMRAPAGHRLANARRSGSRHPTQISASEKFTQSGTVELPSSRDTPIPKRFCSGLRFKISSVLSAGVIA